MKPDEITKEQLYKLLHVSKRKAKWMLDEGIIPCVNRGTKTHTYLIRMEDVQIYNLRFDSNNNLVSFFYNPAKHEYVGFVTNIIHVESKYGTPLIKGLLRELNETFDKIISLKGDE